MNSQLQEDGPLYYGMKKIAVIAPIRAPVVGTIAELLAALWPPPPPPVLPPHAAVPPPDPTRYMVDNVHKLSRFECVRSERVILYDHATGALLR